MLYDTHCHLDYLAKEGFDLQKVVKEARENGVKIINNVLFEFILLAIYYE